MRNLKMKVKQKPVKKLPLLLLFLMCIVWFAPQMCFAASPETDFVWDGDIVKCSNNYFLTVVDIPSHATGIAMSAFANNTRITSVTIPAGIKTISAAAFSGCSNLKTLVISDGVTSISDNAFKGCTSLTSVVIPNSVTSIGTSAFSGCMQLTSLTISDTLPAIGANAFEKCTSLTSVTIPNSVKTIGDSAFYNCTNLTTLTISNTTTSIGISSFQDCNKLTGVTMPNTVTSMGGSAFRGCSALSSVVISNQIGIINPYTFDSCTSLASVTIPSSVTWIGSYAFSGCSALTNVAIPDSVTRIDSSAFIDCTGVTSISIGSGLKTLSTNAFNNETKLKTITVDSTNTNFSSDNDVLLNKTKTSLIKCPIAKVGTYDIPNTVTTIEHDSFIDCAGLTGVTIPEGVTLIDSQAFENCSGLTSIIFPTTLALINGNAFMNCTGLTSVNLVKSNAAYDAFYGCSKLTDINVDATNTNYSSVSGVLFSKSQDKLEMYPSGKAGAYTVPNSVKYLGQDCFRGCALLTSVTIPATVQLIMTTNVFTDCTSLKHILLTGKTNSEASAFMIAQGISAGPGVVIGDVGSPSTAPVKSQFVLANGYGDYFDTITYTGAVGDIVNIYSDATGGSSLGAGEVTAGRTTAVIHYPFGSAAGVIYISLATGTTTESITRTQLKFSDENGVGGEQVAASAPIASQFVVVNSVGASDTITYTGQTGDIINIYTSASGGASVATGTVTFGATVNITYSLGASAGSIYASLTTATTTESTRTQIDFSAEDPGDGGTTAVSSPPAANKFVIINNKAGTADTITYTGTAGDIIKIYSAASGGSSIGTATVALGQTTAVITITQLTTGAGSVYATLATLTATESTRVQLNYIAEAGGTTSGTTKQPSTAPSSSSFVIVNNLGTSDTITYTGSAGDIIKIYTADSGGTALGTGTVALGKTVVVITKSLGETAGSVYASLSTSKTTESTRTKLDFSAVQKTTAPDVAKITVKNNYVGTADTVEVTGLAVGDILKAYDKDTSGKVLGTVTVATSATSATLKIGQLGKTAGSVYITLLSKGKQESATTKVDYMKEPTTTAPIFGTGSDNQITITNKADIADTVKVTGLLTGDIIKVYDKPTTDSTAKSLGSATVAATKTEATVSIKQLAPSASSTSGSVYVTVKTKGKQESDSTKADYIAEQKTTGIDAQKVLIVNDEASDLIVVWGLKAGDILKVYKTATPLTKDDILCTGTVGKTKTFVSLAVKQLGADAGNVYITVKSTGYLESDPTTVGFEAEN